MDGYLFVFTLKRKEFRPARDLEPLETIFPHMKLEGQAYLRLWSVFSSVEEVYKGYMANTVLQKACTSSTTTKKKQ